MKRIAWILSLALLSAGPVSAVMVEASGRGEVLIVPYYTVQAGQRTELSVINHSNTGKALKVRFYEGRNGRQTYAFNLYLSEYDVWTATLGASSASGEAQLSTPDNSCTVPAIRTSAVLPQLPDGSRYVPFSTAGFSGANADGGPVTAARTREGYVEIIEMGALVNNSDSDRAADHVGGVPRDCDALEQAWGKNGYWAANPEQDLAPPSADLSATATIIDPANSAQYAAQATALSTFSVVVQHSGPAAALPDLSSAVTDPARLQVESAVLSQGRLYRSQWPPDRAIDAVSAALSVTTLSNEFNVEAASQAQSEWIITFPTRRHYPVSADIDSMRPFRVGRPGAEKPQTTCASPTLPTMLYDRNSRRTVVTVFPQPDPNPLIFCSSVQSLSFQAAEGTGGPSLLRSDLSRLVSTILTTPLAAFVLRSGFAHFDFVQPTHVSRPALSGETYVGIPAIGMWIQRSDSAPASARKTGSYSAVIPHQRRSNCMREGQPCAAL